MGGSAGYLPGGGGASGRASVLSSAAGHHRRGSAVNAAAPAPPQPSPAEVLARQQRRQQAEEERALERLAGLLQKLQAAERAVLLNGEQHARLAQYHAVQLCRDAGQAAAGNTAGSCADDTEAGRQQVASVHSTNTSAAASPAALSLEGSAPEERTPPGAASCGASAAGSAGSATSLGSAKAQLPELQLLWSWQSELAGELPVSCLAFNRAAPGLLAVGYGRLEHAVSSAGLVAVWSLAHPSHPVWHAATPCGVSALDWSGRAPSCLAVGFFDGGLALYDVRAGGGSKGATAQPLVSAPPAGAGGAGGAHAEPVWRLRHVPKPEASEAGREMLVSVSTDGRLLEWKHAQGLERGELLRLRRRPGGKEAAQVG